MIAVAFKQLSIVPNHEEGAGNGKNDQHDIRTPTDSLDWNFKLVLFFNYDRSHFVVITPQMHAVLSVRF